MWSSCSGVVGIVFREIEAGVFSPLGPGGLVVGSGGFFLDLEEAEIAGFAFVLDIGHPLLSPSTVGDAEVLGSGGS